MQGKLKEITNERIGRLWGLLRWFFAKGYNTIAVKDLQFASVSWFVLAWLALKWIPPRLGWSLAMYAVEIISYLGSWSCVTNLVVGLCVWSKSFKGKATLQTKTIVDVVAHLLTSPKTGRRPKDSCWWKKNQEKSHIWPVVIYDNIWLCNCNCTDAKQWAPPLQYCHGWESAWRRKSLENKKKEKKQAKQT